MTSTRVGLPACLITLVNASCTTRYADSSTPAWMQSVVAFDMERHRHPGATHVVHEMRQVGRARAPARGTAHPSLSRSTPSRRRSSVERAARGRRDRLERSACLLGSLVEDVGADAGLDGDHRHRVGDDVVQLLGDAQPLLGQHAGRTLAFPLCPLVGLPHPRFCRRPAAAQGDSDRPEGRELGDHPHDS